MILNQETFNLSPYMAIYDIVVSKGNMLRQINELVDFSFILEELKTKYCLDNGRNAIPPIRMFKYLLLKAISNVSDVNKHGYDQASAAGLFGMQIQGAMTIFAVNLKRILKLLNREG